MVQSKNMNKKSKKLIPNYIPFVPKESIDNAVATLKTNWIGGDGPKVKEFEVEIAKIIKNKNVFAVSSGTAALQMALRLSRVAGGEVVSSPMTCFATNAAIVNEGGIPVWADIDPTTGNIDPNDIAKKITKRTRAIMVVHWGGAPAEIDTINRIAAIYKIPVIEDAAQALGSEYAGKPIGTHSDFVAFSTQAIKIINTIDGGLLATKKKIDTKRGKILRWYGIDRERRTWDKHFTLWKYPIREIGYKAQMTDVNAAIGLGQIPYFKNILTQRRKNALLYEKALKESKSIRFQKILPEAESNYWMFTVLCKDAKTKKLLWEKMRKISVKIEQAHTRNDIYPVFRRYRKEKLQGVTYFNEHHVIVPVGHWVDSKMSNAIANVLSGF